MKNQKTTMAEIAILYYEKKMTQQEIAKTMHLTRQTVSKLLSEAEAEGIVEIKVKDPKRSIEELSEALVRAFSLSGATVSPVSRNDQALRALATARAGADTISPLLLENGKRVAISWGRTIESFVLELPKINTEGNVVFPLFGATERKQSYFMSNELACNFAKKIDAEIQYAWFPYKPDSKEDCELFKRTAYYRNMLSNWENIDIAIVGIGNIEAINLLDRDFSADEGAAPPVSDIATHTFDQNGRATGCDNNTLAVSLEALKNAKSVIAMACGDHKVSAIRSALASGVITHLVTDEYTAKKILFEGSGAEG